MEYEIRSIFHPELLWIASRNRHLSLVALKIQWNTKFDENSTETALNTQWKSKPDQFSPQNCSEQPVENATQSNSTRNCSRTAPELLRGATSGRNQLKFDNFIIQMNKFIDFGRPSHKLCIFFIFSHLIFRILTGTIEKYRTEETKWLTCTTKKKRRNFARLVPLQR